MTQPQDEAPSTLGGTVGGKITRLVADATVHTKQRLSTHQAALAQKVIGDFTNHVSDEIRGVMGPVWRKIALDPDTPPELAALFGKLGNERGQAWAWIAGQSIGVGMAGGIINLLTNYMNPGILPLIAAHPNNVLDAGTAATAATRGAFDTARAREEAAQTGINSDRFNVLAKLAVTHPGLPELNVMLNRGATTLADVRASLRAVGIPANYIDDLISLRHVDHSPEDLAAMWNRDIVTTAQANALGARAGMDATQMGRLFELGGEPPAIQELLLAWRRGIVDEKAVNRAIVQGPIRKEWIPVIKALQWEPLPISEAADAVNQGHMTLNAARKVARVNGVKDEDFDIVLANAGLPPGPQETLDWVNRGLITEQQGLQALYESRIKNSWVPTYMRSRHETMPPETVRLMYSRGAITAADALRRLQMRGYSPADAAIILDGASAEKTATSRDLTQSQIRDLYADRAISRDEAAGWLQTLGYEADEAVWILELADLQRVRRFFTAATTRVRSAYVANRIDGNEASALLDRIGVPAEQRDDMLNLWDIERDTTSKALTPAQITTAVKKGIIDATAGLSRLVGQGYAPDDAAILLELAGVTT